MPDLPDPPLQPSQQPKPSQQHQQDRNPPPDQQTQPEPDRQTQPDLPSLPAKQALPQCSGAPRCFQYYWYPLQMLSVSSTHSSLLVQPAPRRLESIIRGLRMLTISMRIQLDIAMNRPMTLCALLAAVFIVVQWICMAAAHIVIMRMPPAFPFKQFLWKTPMDSNMMDGQISQLR